LAAGRALGECTLTGSEREGGDLLPVGGGGCVVTGRAPKQAGSLRGMEAEKGCSIYSLSREDKREDREVSTAEIENGRAESCKMEKGKGGE